MLDDFKTELKRLNVKRMRKEELRRHSVALVDDYQDPKDGDGDGDDHMEFSDALNTNPLRFQTTQNLDGSPGHSPMGRLRHDSITDSRTSEKEPVGKAGKKISKLPGLKEFTERKKKAKVQDPEKTVLEKNAPRVTMPPQASDRLADMRRSLGVIDLHDR